MSKIYADEIDTNALNKLHSVQLEILDEIVRVCEINNLKYYLSSGTLLGAARHKGFIPWDDDLDIAMPRDDYNKFCKISLSGGLDRKYYFHSHETDSTYWLSFGKVRKLGTVINEECISTIDAVKGIYVDVFPLDTVRKAGTVLSGIRTFIIKCLSAAIYCRRKINIPVTWRLRMIDFVSRPFSIKFLAAVQTALMCSENNSGGKYYINYGSNYNTTLSQTTEKSKYEPCCMLPFEGKYYRAPREYDFILSKIYGDYMQLPSEEMRTLRHRPVYIDFGD